MILFLAKLISCILLAAFGNAQQPSDAWASYTATFGRQGADCAGRGICSFTEDTEAGNVRLQYSASDSVLTLQIINDKVGSAVLARQITQGLLLGEKTEGPLFTMESDYVLSPTVKGALQLQQGLQRIPKGNYKAYGANGATIVQFKLK